MSSPLDLHAEVITADGVRYRWDANQAPGSRLQNLSFSTKIGEGFSSAQGQLARRIDQDYPDLNLIDTVVIVGGDGSVAWEGRVSALPRELGDTHSVGVTLTGWMAHAKDKEFREIYVDRDLGSWGEPTARQKAAQMAANFMPYTGPETRTSPTNDGSSIFTEFSGSWISPFKPLSEAWYDASGISLGQITATHNPAGALNPVDTNWQFFVTLNNEDDYDAVTYDTTANLRPTTPSTVTLAATTVTRAWASMYVLYNATPSTGDGTVYSLQWSKVAVYGTHGLTTVAGETGQPNGVLASDVIKNIASRWCPQLDTGDVVDTGYVIQHLAFKDSTTPYDAFLEVNKYHLWQLAVWENKKLHFEPYDLDDYDWEIRTDDPGTTFAPQGDSVDDLFNGVTVKYTDALKGTVRTLTPAEFPELETTDPANPWNQHGVDHWYKVELSTPSTQAQALQLGVAALGERNTPKSPGTITVGGYIRDRAGNQQPVWKVRAGDTISVTNFPNDTPRLIVETSYDDERKEVSLSIDRPFALLDSYLDRIGTALTARGLT